MQSLFNTIKFYLTAVCIYDILYLIGFGGREEVGCVFFESCYIEFLYQPNLKLTKIS